MKIFISSDMEGTAGICHWNETEIGKDLYSHFANKQDILDTVVETVLKGYADHSIFVRADWDDPVLSFVNSGSSQSARTKIEWSA